MIRIKHLILINRKISRFVCEIKFDTNAVHTYRFMEFWPPLFEEKIKLILIVSSIQKCNFRDCIEPIYSNWDALFLYPAFILLRTTHPFTSVELFTYFQFLSYL